MGLSARNVARRRKRVDEGAFGPASIVLPPLPSSLRIGVLSQCSGSQMVLPTGVSPRMDMASRQCFSGCEESCCAYKLRLSAAIYDQMYAQTLGVVARALSAQRGGLAYHLQFWDTSGNLKPLPATLPATLAERETE
jgi:hypothetical protein